VAELNDQPSSP
jgi:hypothetical protein